MILFLYLYFYSYRMEYSFNLSVGSSLASVIIKFFILKLILDFFRALIASYNQCKCTNKELSVLRDYLDTLNADKNEVCDDEPCEDEAREEACSDEADEEPCDDEACEEESNEEELDEDEACEEASARTDDADESEC